MDLTKKSWNELQVEDAVIYVRPFLSDFMEVEARIFAEYRALSGLDEKALIPLADSERLQVQAFLEGGAVGGWKGFTSGNEALPDVAPGTLSAEHYAAGQQIVSHPDIHRLVRQRCTAITREYYSLEEQAKGN